MTTSLNYLSAKEAKEKVEVAKTANKEIYRIKKLIKFSALTGKTCITTPIKLFNECIEIIMDHFKKHGFEITKNVDTNEVHIKWHSPSNTELDNERESKGKWYIETFYNDDIDLMTAKYAYTLYLKYTNDTDMLKWSMNQIFNKINEATKEEFVRVNINGKEIRINNYILFVLDYLGFEVKNYLNNTTYPFIVIEWGEL